MPQKPATEQEIYAGLAFWSDLNCNFSNKDAEKIWGKHWEHMYNKFLETNGNPVSFYNSLDNGNRELIIKWHQEKKDK